MRALALAVTGPELVIVIAFYHTVPIIVYVLKWWDARIENEKDHTACEDVSCRWVIAILGKDFRGVVAISASESSGFGV